MTKTPIRFPPRGPFASREQEMPLVAAFRELRDRWLKKYKTTKEELANRIGVSPQAASQWASGSDPSKRPPLWALAALADDLRLALLVTGDGIRFVRRQRADAGRSRVDG